MVYILSINRIIPNTAKCSSRSKLLILYALSVLLISCNSKNEDSVFSFINSDEGTELKENGSPVFFYQKLPKSLTGEYICNNYIHPLYNLKGDTLTEEFPADHPYHRGVFWAWHQVYIDGKSIGDDWIMENIESEIVSVETVANNQSAQLSITALWISPIFEDRNPFIMEQTTIKVYPQQNDVRKIDFAISLKALLPNVEIGGSDDEKGYGGLCVRLKLPEDLSFTSLNKPVNPQNLQIKAGPWMDFSGSFGTMGEASGVAILCHPDTPNYPAPWILRKETSMQNIVFPGRERINIPIHKAINLYYRLIIHNGNAQSINLSKFQSEYEETTVSN